MAARGNNRRVTVSRPGPRQVEESERQESSQGSSDSEDDDDHIRGIGRPEFSTHSNLEAARTWASGASGSSPENPLNEPADVFFNHDIFDSVLVSAFGGVTMNLSGDDELVVHPVMLFLFCLPLVFVQAWLTFCVGLDLDFKASMYRGDASDRMVMSMKLVLVVVVQLIFFDRMLSSLRCLVFTLNPSSWTDIKRVDPSDERIEESRCSWAFYAPLVAVWPVLALTLKLGIEYWVCVQSASIVLASPSLKEAIFDSLAISFIIELDGSMWKFVSTVLHLNKFEGFVFKFWPDWRREQATQDSFVMRSELMKCEWLHRGKGARRIENIITFVIMHVLYMRQVLVVLHSLHSGILPVARDICTYARYAQGQGHDKLLQGFFMSLFETSSIFGWQIEEQLSLRADPARGGFCTAEYDRIKWSTIIHLIQLYPGTCVLFAVGISVVLVMPQLFYSSGFIRKAFSTLNLDGYGCIERQRKQAHKKKKQESAHDAVHEECRNLRSQWDTFKMEMEAKIEERMALASMKMASSSAHLFSPSQEWHGSSPHHRAHLFRTASPRTQHLPKASSSRAPSLNMVRESSQRPPVAATTPTF